MLRKPIRVTLQSRDCMESIREAKSGRPKHTWRRGMEAEMVAKGYNFSGLEKMAQNCVRWRSIVDGLYMLHPGAKGNDDDDDVFYCLIKASKTFWVA